MKTNSLPVLPFLVALAALVLPLSVEISASFVAIAGIAALFLSDYAREIKPLAVPAGAPVARVMHALPCAA